VLRQLASDPDTARSDFGIGVGFEHPDRLSDDDVRSYVGACAGTDEAALETQRFIASLDSADLEAVEAELRAFDRPTLIVWGTEDVFFALTWAAWLRDTIPGAGDVVEIEGAHASANGFAVWKTRYATIGVLICWDQWYPEGARITSLLGAQILFYPTAIGWHPAERQNSGAAQADAWRTAQRAHAIANGVFVASPNRVGHEDEPGTQGITFFGHSFIADPFGRVIADGGFETEEILIAECDPAIIEETRRNWPFLRDRRIDAYGPILSRYLGR